jgi:drug/metabolite transporter (DMT)-like permease
MKESTVGSAVLVTGTVIVSSLFAVLKSLEDVPPLLRASWRLQTTFLALAFPSSLSVYLRAQLRSRANNQTAQPTNRKDKSRIRDLLCSSISVDSVRAGCGWAMYNIGLCYAVATASLIRSSILSQCAPLFIVFYQCLQSAFPKVLGQSSDRVHWKHIAGVMLTMIGTTLFVLSTASEEARRHIQKQSNNSIVGDLWGAFASAGYAMYCTYGRRARQKVPVFIHLPTCCFTSMVIVSAVAWISQNGGDSNTRNSSASPIFEESIGFCQSHLLGWTCAEYLTRMVYLGVVCGAIAVTMINWSMSKVQALEAATANSSEPVFATIIGVVVFGEPIPTVTAVLAAAIIVYAMILCSTQGEKNSFKIKDDHLQENSFIRREMRTPLEVV